MANTRAAYWADMKDKAARHIAAIAEEREPETEDDVKEDLAKVLKHGSCKDAAEAIVEACEFMLAHHEHAVCAMQPAVAM